MAADYSTWTEKIVAVTNLSLDPKNFRIPATASPLGPRDLIADLVEQENAYGLARDIVEQGYFPTESLIVVVEDGKNIVVEGNRRLAALKCLISDNQRVAGPRHQHFDGVTVIVERSSKDVLPGASPQRQRAQLLIDFPFDLSNFVGYGHSIKCPPAPPPSQLTCPSQTTSFVTGHDRLGRASFYAGFRTAPTTGFVTALRRASG